MKVLKVFIITGIIGAVVVLFAVGIIILNIKKSAKGFKMYGELKEFRYRPGYSDMDGGYHSDVLYKGDDGKWIIESRNRSSMSDPTVVTKYVVGYDSEIEFEAYLKSSDIPSLENRKDSDLFVTDYTPWHYTIVFELQTDKGIEIQEFDLDEYKEYSDKDYSLIKSMKTQFDMLKSNKISEETEED